jgi:Bacterial PH domain
LAGSRLQLLPGEEVLVDIKPHWSFLTGPLIVSVVVISIGVALDIGYPNTSVALHWVEGGVVALPCLWLAARVVRWRMTSVIVTSMRLVEQWGVMSRQNSEVPLSHIASVTAVQSFVRRILATGRLEFTLYGEDRVRWIDDVRKPAVLRRIIARRIQPLQSPGPEFG